MRLQWKSTRRVECLIIILNRNKQEAKGLLEKILYLCYNEIARVYAKVEAKIKAKKEFFPEEALLSSSYTEAYKKQENSNFG